jgi:hypothetical protein
MEDKFGKAKKSIEDVKQVLKRIGEDARKRKVEGEKKKEQEESKVRPAVGVDYGPELEVISEEDEGSGDSDMGDGSSWASG